MTPDEALVRWRLVLGADADSLGCQLDGDQRRQDAALEFLYGREYGPNRNVRRTGTAGGPRSGGQEDSALTVPEWINTVHQLFPKTTIERLEKDALERYQLQEMVTNPDLLARAEPSLTLLKAVLHTKHLMNQQVLTLAREVVRKVIEDLMAKFARPVRAVFHGSLLRKRSWLKVAKNFDARTTVRRNLKSFDPVTGKLAIQTPFFLSRTRRQIDRWQVIVLVDQSGSMVDSVIHAAVTAAIFFGIPTLRPSLVAFDTNVVDLSSDCADPVELLMKVQLGGGTDIGLAVRYAAGLVDNPRRTIVVLVSDFFEGGPPDRLFAAVRGLVESGVKVLGLAALDDRAEPNFDRHVAQTLVQLGAHVAAMTPGQLAEWVAAVMNG